MIERLLFAKFNRLKKSILL